MESKAKHQSLGHMMTTEQTPSTEEDHEMWLKGLEKILLLFFLKLSNELVHSLES